VETHRHISSGGLKMLGAAHDVPQPSASRASGLLTEVGDFLRRVSAVQKQHGLAPDELLTFLALGRLALSVSTIGVTVRPVKCSELSFWMKAPKETVRRRLSRLVDRGLVTMTKRGAMLGKVDEWIRVASSIAS
jgi:hypothetical protein